jgi:uncharacterized protein YfiM (DUF2279 family)
VLDAAAHNRYVMRQAELIFANSVAAQVVGAQRHHHERMQQRKSTRFGFASFEDTVEEPTEALVCAEDSGGLILDLVAYTWRAQRHDLTALSTPRQEVDVQAQVPQKELRLELQ